MRALTVLATCGALVYHLIAGCCAHHLHRQDAAAVGQVEVCQSHGCCHEHDGEPAGTQDEKHADGDDHAAHGAASQANSEPAPAVQGSSIVDSKSPHSRCDGASCAYLPTSKTLLPTMIDGGLTLLPPAWCIAPTRHWLAAVGHPRDWLDTGPPTRAHLLKCVLLV